MTELVGLHRPGRRPDPQGPPRQPGNSLQSPDRGRFRWRRPRDDVEVGNPADAPQLAPAISGSPAAPDMHHTRSRPNRGCGGGRRRRELRGLGYAASQSPAQGVETRRCAPRGRTPAATPREGRMADQFGRIGSTTSNAATARTGAKLAQHRTSGGPGSGHGVSPAASSQWELWQHREHHQRSHRGNWSWRSLAEQSAVPPPLARRRRVFRSE